MEVATLAIKVDSTDVGTATNKMNALTNAGGGVVSMLAKIAGAAGFALLARQMFDTNVEFQRLQSSLVTVTGSTESAARAFAMVQGFAKQTPYEVAELTQAFIDLKTRGMDAGIGSMTSYGNMASAFGRSLTDLVRAVSGVAMGESEAIKSFGVQAMTQGDRISLTFKGQTEVIKRTVGDVEAYFKRLSDANFASGMERQAETLGGVLSNLKDQIAATFFEIGNAGVSGALTQSVLGLTKTIADATPTLAKFASATVSGLASAVSFVDRYKLQIAGLVIVLGTMAAAQTLVASTTLASGVAAVAQTVRTIALTFAVTGYSVSATAAAVATSAWSAASLGGIAAFGLLAAALAALYLATKSLRKEMEELDKQVANNKPWKDRYEFQKSFAEGTKDIEANIKTLKAALGGNKAALEEASSPSIAAYRRDAAKLGGEAFDRQIKMRLEAEKTEKKLREQLDARNRATKEAASIQEKLQQQSKEYLRTLQDEVATYGMGRAEIERYKASKLGLLNNPAFKEKQTLDRIRRNDVSGSETEADWLETQQRIRRANAQDLTANLDQEASAYQNALNTIYPYRSSLMQLGEAYEDLTYSLNVGKISQAQFMEGEKLLLEQTRQSLPVMTEWFGDLRDTIQGWSRSSTDAFTEFCFTGKAQFSDLITSMLRDLARLTVQKNVMGPLFNWLSMGISSWAGGGGSSGDGGGVIAQNTWNPDPIVPIPTNSLGGGGQIVNNINVSVQSDGSVKTSSEAGAKGSAIAKELEGLMDAWAVKQSRTGGLLARG